MVVAAETSENLMSKIANINIKGKKGVVFGEILSEGATATRGRKKLKSSKSLKEGSSQKTDAEDVAVEEPKEVHLEVDYRLPKMNHSTRNV